jgi:DNA excision repair protein ERCC-2
LTFDGSIFYFEKADKNNYKVKLFNINPSYHLEKIRRKSTIFFSATLSPIKYYKEILGGKDEDNIYIFPSPFDIKNRKILFSNEISTRYRERYYSITVVCKYINQFINNNVGNNIVFFPSYEYLRIVLEKYMELYDKDILVQSRNMTEDEREKFILEFETGNIVTAFAVLGGIFSEGIDLKGDKLKGVILVGIGLPGFGLENDIIKRYYEEQEHKGFEYAYSYPAIIKIMQSVGRVIRTSSDKGAILLLGDRFITNYYRKMLPFDWGNELVTLETLNEKLKSFWDIN